MTKIVSNNAHQEFWKLIHSFGIPTGRHRELEEKLEDYMKERAVPQRVDVHLAVISGLAPRMWAPREDDEEITPKDLLDLADSVANMYAERYLK